jgi:hypothetical protein
MGAGVVLVAGVSLAGALLFGTSPPVHRLLTLLLRMLLQPLWSKGVEGDVAPVPGLRIYGAHLRWC